MTAQPLTDSSQDHALAPLELLASSSRRLACVVSAISRRRDVRELRARLVLLLLRMRCPLRGVPSKSWYIPGAVARLGAQGLRRAWSEAFGLPAPSLRTLRSHLGALEEALVLVRAPGEWLPMMRNPEHLERRPRHAETFHILESEEAAAWWASEGKELLERNPKAKTNPDTWRSVFGSWRSASKGLAPGQGLLFGVNPNPPALPVEPEEEERRAEAKATLREAVRASVPNVFDLMLALRSAGAHIKKANSFRVAANPLRLRGAAAMLWLALERGDRIRNRAAWLVWAWKRATAQEMAFAMQEAQR